jgi:predicted permease
MLLMAFDTDLVGYDAQRSQAFYRELRDRAATLPSVVSATVTSTVPMKVDTLRRERVAPEGFQLPDGVDNVTVLSALVDENYFATLDIPVVAGRAFQASDIATSPPVAIINETMARLYWPDRDAVGQRIRLDSHDGVLADVVGIATDAKYTWIGEAPRGFVYLPLAQSPIADNTLLVRTDAEAAALAEPLRDVVRAIDPDMPPFGIRTMEDFYHSRAVHTTNLMLGNVAGMGAIGLLLAVVGLYGVISHAATRRTKEFGIRLATGATPKMLLTSVLRQGAFIVSWGVVTGLIASIAVERLLVSTFPGIVDADAMTLVLVVIMVVTVTLAASYVPARRAARTDPIVALRAD